MQDPSDTLRALQDYVTTSLDEHLARHATLDPAARALALFHRAARDMPAYARFLAAAGIEPSDIAAATDLARVPTTSKDQFLRVHPLGELAVGPADTVAVSSGSTGVPTYFPRGWRHELEVVWRFEQVFRDGIGAHVGTTLAVVCFPLGTWVGGMFTAACCRLLALKGYRLLVVTPGNQPPEIHRAVRELGPLHDRVVLLGYPPFLKDVIDGAPDLDWGARPLSLVLAGEVVSEAWRDILFERCGRPGDITRFAFSLYGTADAGVLGVESSLCTAIRRFCAERGDAADALFGSRRLPTLVQYDPADRYFEAIGDDLVFTGEGGAIPLVRYAIGDTGGVVPYDTMLERLAAFGFEVPPGPSRRLPFVYVFGRRQHAVSFYGANVFVEVVRLGLEHSELRGAFSGKLVMEVLEDAAGDSHLLLDVERARGGEGDDAALADAVARRVVDALLAASPEFGAYVPEARRRPQVRVWAHGHPQHFPVGVKHRYVRA
ncbi:MAG: phenylacetate--CoA ligase family protein [Polyangiaceae bacterium]